MSNILDEIDGDFDIKEPEPVTTELGLFQRWTEGKHPKIFNCHYWLKHELYVYKSLQEKLWIVSKPNGPTRLQVSNKELARALLEYYFEMVTHSSFYGERTGERGKLVDMDKFLDLVIEEPTIKKLIERPELLS